MARFRSPSGRAYDSLSPAERRRTAILVDNYGEAAALDLYGTPYGLPPALSGHNEYYLWRLRGEEPRDIVCVQTDPAVLRPYCARMTVLGTTHSRYAREFENGRAIALCRSVHPSLEALRPSLERVI